MLSVTASDVPYQILINHSPVSNYPQNILTVHCCCTVSNTHHKLLADGTDSKIHTAILHVADNTNQSKFYYLSKVLYRESCDYLFACFILYHENVRTPLFILFRKTNILVLLQQHCRPPELLYLCQMLSFWRSGFILLKVCGFFYTTSITVSSSCQHHSSTLTPDSMCPFCVHRKVTNMPSVVLQLSDCFPYAFKKQVQNPNFI